MNYQLLTKVIFNNLKIRVRTFSVGGTQPAAFLSNSHCGAGKLYNLI
jgi:hypothetical protein